MASPGDRRRTVRIRVDGRLRIDAEPAGLVMELVDISMGGFCVRTRTQVPLNVITNFRFSTPDGKWSGRLSARSLHSKLHKSGEGPPVFLTGFVFVQPDSPDVERDVATMMDLVTSLSFS